MSSQEVSGGKFLPVFFVDEVKEGAQFQAGEWPIHMTLFPPLETSYGVLLGRAMRYITRMYLWINVSKKELRYGSRVCHL
jgi:hypothetical protein